MSTARRLDRLEARAPARSKEDGLTEDQLGDLSVIAGFARSAKAHGHLEEFDLLLQCVREAAATHDLPDHPWRWLQEARSAQLPPVEDWPPPEQVVASDERLREMVRLGAAEPEGGFGHVDLVVGAMGQARAGEHGPDTDEPFERWIRMVAARVEEQLDAAMVRAGR